MAAYTKNTPGAPDSGLYAFGDSVTDSLGVVWQCIRGGLPSLFTGSHVVLTTAGTAALPDMTIDSGVTATVTKVTNSAGGVRRTILTLAGVSQSVVNGTEFQFTKLVTFPEGRILILGVLATLAQTTTTDPATTINANSNAGAVSLGSAQASNVALTGTMVDMLPSTNYTPSATINVAGTAVTAALAASAQFNGTATPIAMYLNTGFGTTTDVDANGTQTFAGTIQITWVPLGDL